MLRLIIRWSLGLYAFYLGLCLLLVMPALNIFAPRLVAEHLQRELRSELILFNPFSLALEVYGASILEQDGHQPVALDRLSLNLSASSLWEPGVVLDAFLVEELDIHVLRYASGDFHFEDLVGESSTPAAEDPSAPLYVTIRDLAIDAHTLRFTDATRPGPFSTVQRDFELRTRNVTTVPNRSGDGVLELISDGGGRLRWKGDIDIAAGRSEGRLTLENIDLTHLWRYNAESLAFVLHRARFGADLKFAADWADELQLRFSDSRLRLHDTEIKPADVSTTPNTAIGLADLSVDGIALDLQARDLAIEAVTLTGLDVEGFDRDGDASLMTLFAAPETATEATSTDDGTSASAVDEEASWSVSIASVGARDNALRWRTGFLAPELMTVTPLEFSLRDFTWPATAAAPAMLSLRVNDMLDLGVDGAIDVSSGAGQFTIALQQLPLDWLNPLVNEQARTDIRRGHFDLESTVELADFGPTIVTGTLAISDFATELHETGEQAFSLASLTVNQFETRIAERLTRVDLLTLDGPAGSLHIREDGRMNINGVIRELPEGTQGEASADAGGEGTEEGSEESDEPWGLILDRLQLQSGRLDFADSSLPLPFQVMIENINADLEDLDSTSDAPLSLALRGNVDGYAPVEIIGSGAPLAETRSGQVQFSFRGIDIATMSPYSGTYAGYKIDSGTLTLDLRYGLQGQTIQGDNRIIISQMQLGEPVESELAIDVPLKLGIALLTDSDGVIDLDVPVSGSVDDPEFSLGRVIGRAIGNVIVKAVTAPFSLLSSLVGSDDDLENIAYPSGISEPDGDGQQALAALGKALTARPQLQLQIAGAVDAQADGRALREAQLKTTLQAEGLSATAIEQRDDSFAARVGELYAAQLEPAAVSDDDADDKSSPPSLEAQWQTLIKNQPLPATALPNLARERAAAAKRILVTDQAVDAARIAISFDTDLNTAGVRMKLDS